jgi:putative ABC transport system substrate-binding protein
MDRRRFLLTSLAGALTGASGVEAQLLLRVYRIGYLGGGSESAQANRFEAFRAGLRDLGYVEGKNIIIDFKWAEGRAERLLDLAGELVRLKVDVLVTAGTPAVLAAKRATTTIPIVMAGSGDAVASGLVASLARPGGNVTGSTDSVPQLLVKALELLKPMLPGMRRVAVLVVPRNTSNRPVLQALQSAAGTLNVEVQEFEVREPREFHGAFSRMMTNRVNAVVVTTDGLLNENITMIAELASKTGLPAVGAKELAEAGGLIGYGLNFPEMYRRAAYFVDKILKGVKPADLPVQQPTTFDLVVNLKSAKALGLTIPPSLLARADQVIE